MARDLCNTLLFWSFIFREDIGCIVIKIASAKQKEKYVFYWSLYMWYLFWFSCFKIFVFICCYDLCLMYLDVSLLGMNTKVFLAVSLRYNVPFYVLSCYYKTSWQSIHIATDNSFTDDIVVNTEDLYLKVSGCLILAVWELFEDRNTKSFPEI